MKKNELFYKKEYKNKIVSDMKEKYKEFEIIDDKFNEIYNKIDSNDLNYETEDDLYLSILCAYRKKLENYIMNECINNNLLYQIMLAEKKEVVVQRYLSLKKLNKEKKDLDSISFGIMEELVNNYDSNETLDNQYIKKLKKKYNK